jgi:hypothetical protein
MSQSRKLDAPLIMERLGKLSESDRSFDVEFWQRQGPTAIFAAAWEMALEAHKWNIVSVMGTSIKTPAPDSTT